MGVLLEALRYPVRWRHIHCPGACACTSFTHAIYFEPPRPSLFACTWKLAYCPTLLPFPEHVWCQRFHHLALSLTFTPTTTTNLFDYAVNISPDHHLNLSTPPTSRRMCAGDTCGDPCIIRYPLWGLYIQCAEWLSYRRKLSLQKCPVDPGSIQGRHRLLSLMRNNNTEHARICETVTLYVELT